VSAAPLHEGTDNAAFAARVAACRARIEVVLEQALALPDPGTARLRDDGRR
jgi:hypothetical protein